MTEERRYHLRQWDDKAFSIENKRNSLDRMMNSTHIPIIDYIKELINSYKLKQNGLTNLLTWDDRLQQAEYLLRKLEEVNGIAISDDDLCPITGDCVEEARLMEEELK